MIIIADQKSRLTFGSRIRPGQAFDVEELDEGEFRVVRMERRTGRRLTLEELYAPVLGAGFKAPKRSKAGARKVKLV